MARKVLIGVLVVSLSLNLGLVGYMVGKSFGSHWHGRDTAAWTGSPMDYILRPLGRERVKELIPLTQEHRKQIHQRLRELRQAQQELYLATVEEPFSPERLEEAQIAFNVLFLAAKARQDSMWLDIAEKLTSEERQLIMEQSMPRRLKDKKTRHPSSDPRVEEETLNSGSPDD